MISPDDLVISGWDCSKMNLGDAMRRAAVLDVQLQDALYETMSHMQPLPAAFDVNFIAMNQADRADNVICTNGDKWALVEQLRSDIRQFKSTHNLRKVIVL